MPVGLRLVEVVGLLSDRGAVIGVSSVIESTGAFCSSSLLMGTTKASNSGSKSSVDHGTGENFSPMPSTPPKPTTANMMALSVLSRIRSSTLPMT